MQNSTADIDKLKGILTQRPTLGKFCENEIKLRELLTYIQFKTNQDSLEGSFTTKLSTEISRLFPEIKSITHNSSLPTISYADHHGLLNYSLLYNSNILSSLLSYKTKSYIITFASAIIPMTNISHPRGFFFKNSKFNFFSERKSKRTLYSFSDILKPDAKIGIDSFITSYDKALLTPQERHFLEHLFFDALEIEKICRQCDNLSDQFSLLNNKLWKLFFDKETEGIPELIYLQSNRIINSMLINLINDEDSLIWRILFDKKTRELYLENFNGIEGCWSEVSGSHFFTGLSSKGRLVRLRYNASTNSLDGVDFSLHLDAASVIEAIETKRVMPTLFFDFLIITFLSGYTALGGFNQIEYLTQMKKAHVTTLQELGEVTLAKTFDSRITDALICGLIRFPHHSALDMIWHYNSTKGTFNGNLDRGITNTELDDTLTMSVRKLLEPALETMANIVQ